MKKVIRYRKPNPIVYRKALEIYFKKHPEAEGITPEIEELYEDGAIQEAQDIIRAELRHAREEELKSLHQKIDYLEQQIDFLEKQLEYREQLLREISENKKGYISELEQRVRELEEERRRLTQKIFQNIDEINNLKRQIRELEKYKPKPQDTQPKPVIIQNNGTQKKGKSLKWTIIKWTIIAIASLIFPLMPILLMPYLYFKISAILYPQNKKQQKITRYFE